MMLLSLMLVVGSGLMNAVWNLFAKKSTDKGVFLGSIMTTAAILLLPCLVWELSVRELPLEAYLFMFFSLSIQSLYAHLLARAYKFGELSRIYPIMRGTGVLIIPLMGVQLLGESVSGPGWFGIACIVAGLLGAGLGASTQPVCAHERSLPFAFLVGLCIAAYTVVDKMTLQYISPLSLLQVSSMGFMLPHLPGMFDRKRMQAEWSHNWKLILLGSILSPGSYLLFLLAMNLAPVSHLAPAREIGTVFAALFGILFLKEKQGWKRILSAAAITAGIILISFQR
jgi:drug/metabolite transporter (DMT)-like permease